ncbi:MAG: hypothetical protein WD355_03815 [Balneolaceae bacterium]
MNRSSTHTPYRHLALLPVLACFLLVINVMTAQAQTAVMPATPNVYLDCNTCSSDYVRTNVSFVNYVRDQSDAHIYLRITRAETGSGREFILDFRGIEPFSSRRDTLIYTSSNTDTSDEERAGLVRFIRIGLLPFAANTTVVENLDVIHSASDEGSDVQVTPETDPWNSWIFDVELGTEMNGEESEFSYEVESSFSAERITEDWKFDFRGEVELDRSEIELSSGTRKVNRDSWRVDGFAAYSIGQRFSLGLFSEVSHSRTQNLDFSLEASPAIEYSLFPYREFQERQFVLQYRITPSYRDYRETTIYLKDSEIVTQQVLSSQLRFDQPWGEIDLRADASTFLHDTSVNSFEFTPSMDIRITRGLSIFMRAQYEVINDQISLPADDISDTERLLGERQRATSYEYSFSFGFSYTFGSSFSNIVNPRFDNIAGGPPGGGGGF